MNLHPATLEVVRNALYAIAEEMSVIVMRSARSPLLKEAGDLSSALTDADGRLIAQGRDIPIHLGVMGFTVKEFLKRVPREQLLRRRRVVPEPARGRRQSPARREGGAPGVRRRPAGRVRDQPRSLGGHRRRRAGELRAVGDGILSGRAPDRADPALLGQWPGTSRHRVRPRQSARPRGARGRYLRPVRRQRRRGAPAPGALRPSRRRDDRRLLRAPARRVGDADAAGDPRAAGRRVGGRGLGRRRRCRRRAHSHPRARRDPGRRGALRLHGHLAPGARPREHDLLHRLLGGLLRDEGAGRAGRAAERRLLPAARTSTYRRARS